MYPYSFNRLLAEISISVSHLLVWPTQPHILSKTEMCTSLRGYEVKASCLLDAPRSDRWQQIAA